ncbi:GNAT family N-acetyltransferase [Streptococcus didelphis]|uniref:GNAT family N-acetyltransferase n=1 Tax=Streptococcus didelphis TaxID=102886 RepID=A0ABY9LHJ3_9STRE|nr:GNAT family N-acetyltransferase [Streptococcus didelphis]WMB28198.1 GNAT family N-acetyltransferase [Streptococcus didelphis]WMB30108.1 GNAT family N-acetyltransferase [Streptococcus didelphis]
MQNKNIVFEELTEKGLIKRIVDIHLSVFPNFFLTFLGKGFLCTLYLGFLEHDSSGIIIAREDENVLGFLAYSKDLSGFYKWLIKHKVIYFGFYGLKACVKSPKAIIRLMRAFLYPSQASKTEKYIEISSIGVSSSTSNSGIGSQLVKSIPNIVDTTGYKYIELTTDAINNEKANYFYQKNGFALNRTFETLEGRKMNEYHRELINEKR